MALVNKGDFIRLDFVARVKDTGQIFDLTDEALAKKEGLYHSHIKYGPKIICVGQGYLLPALDAQLEGKEFGKTYTLTLSSEESFGKKDPSLVKTFSTHTLTEQDIKPYPGLQIRSAYGMVGTVKSVSAGRTVVDFNHPLAGKDVVYELHLHALVDDVKEKVDSVVLAELGLLAKDYTAAVEGDAVSLHFSQPLPEHLHQAFMKRLLDVLPTLRITIV